MTQDEIIRMAREAGFAIQELGDKTCHVVVYNFQDSETDVTKELECFAALVAAHERNRIFDESKHIIKRAEARGAIFEREKQAEQEPVGFGVMAFGELQQSSVHYEAMLEAAKAKQDSGLWDDVEVVELYTHPVRTKDLTDDEIWEAFETHSSDVIKAVRTVIAADRKKNNV